MRSDLSIGGYGYEKELKLEILQREEKGLRRVEETRGEGGELSLFPVEEVKQKRESF